MNTNGQESEVWEKMHKPRAFTRKVKGSKRGHRTGCTPFVPIRVHSWFLICGIRVHRKRNEPQAIGLRLVKRSAEMAYQLDLVTPGIRPLEASSRKAMRESLNRPMNARLRPVALQRRLRRTGLALRGSMERPM